MLKLLSEVAASATPVSIDSKTAKSAIITAILKGDIATKQSVHDTAVALRQAGIDVGGSEAKSILQEMEEEEQQILNVDSGGKSRPTVEEVEAATSTDWTITDAVLDKLKENGGWPAKEEVSL